MNNGKKEYWFLWLIENYSHCWHKNKEPLISPEFIAYELEGTVWCLRLHPRGSREENKGYISLHLYRIGIDGGPEHFPLKYELSVLAADGSILKSIESESTFNMGAGNGCHQFLNIVEIFSPRKTYYLPQDTLNIRCRMWKGEGNLQPITQIKVRTRIGIEQIYFIHVVEDFSAIVQNQKKTVKIKSANKKNCCVVSSNVYITFDDSSEGNIIGEIILPSIKHTLSKHKISLLDASGIVKKCFEAGNESDATRKDIRLLPLPLSKKAILNRKSEYLADDKLSLLCECVFSTGIEYKKIEETLHEIPDLALNQIKNIRNAAEKLSTCPTALDDFKSLYNSQLLTDVEFQTKTKSYPAHKMVLCARSPVFTAMLTNDMKEKNTNCIQIDELDDDIVHKLLLFLYCDELKDLRWETAIKLYDVAEKYSIEKLKIECMNFLAGKLDSSTAVELLFLADMYNDWYLKKLVEDFILMHEDAVFGSEEWEELIETNPQLVIKTMQLKYTRRKVHQK